MYKVFVMELAGEVACRAMLWRIRPTDMPQIKSPRNMGEFLFAVKIAN